MSKTRIYEIARELDLESKAVLARAQELGLEVKTASSGVDAEEAELLRLSYQDETAAPTPAEPGGRLPRFAASPVPPSTALCGG